MDLRTYLSLKGVTATSLAARLGVAHTTVLRWADGTLKPKAQHVADIVAATNGEVTAAELRPDMARAFQLASCPPGRDGAAGSVVPLPGSSR
ncbi:transcriptional regulator [Falsiroseomonas sp.]|uniref:transcriptional regulator n=1 Tax=Falsiroseomonas sp. TaxID=2870721 RepID=UPI003F6F63D8